MSIEHEKASPGEVVPAIRPLEAGLAGAEKFIHRLPLGEKKRTACGEAPAGGIRIVSEAEYLRHPCPDCLRKERPA